MTVIGVPYHLDEYLADLDFPLRPATTVTAALPAGDAWERLAVLYDAVSGAVAADVRRGARPVVLTGDCATSLGIVAGLQAAGADPGIVWFDAGQVAALGLACTWHPGRAAAPQIAPYLAIAQIAG